MLRRESDGLITIAAAAKCERVADA